MFVSDRFVFLELQKTGCTHIRNILSDLFDGELIGKHNQAGADTFTEERVILGSVRDPWEWYISLWAYGCDNKGALFYNVTKQTISIQGLGWKSNPYAAFLRLIVNYLRDPQEWINTYSDVSDAEAFRAWLYMMHDVDHLADIGEGYSDYYVSRIIGLMSFRYLLLFCTKYGKQSNLDELLTFEQIKKYTDRNCFIDHFIRNESLESDLIHGLIKFGANIQDARKVEILSRPKTNVSSRKYGPEYYYDIESENLVCERERLIIERFGYVAPSLR